MMNATLLGRLKTITVVSISAAFLATAPLIDAQASMPQPAFATAMGYTVNTFSANFTTENTDLANTGASGFKWYLWNFFGTHAKAAAVVINPDTSVTLTGDTTGPNGELASATPAKNAAHFVGRAFGGGAYFEAKFKFDPKQTIATGYKGWPSFWSMALEHLATSQDQWQGGPPGFANFAEADFFEYDITPFNGNASIYGGAMHDWTGVFKTTCNGFCDNHLTFFSVLKQLPVGTDLTQYHKYGYLWVPATPSSLGYAQYYFDNVAVGQPDKWAYYDNPSAFAPLGTKMFGVMDKQHMVVIIGTGKNEPMTIAYVNVWQASYANNIQY